MNSRIWARRAFGFSGIAFCMMVGLCAAIGQEKESVGTNVLETAALRMLINPTNGQYCIVEKNSGMVWNSNPWKARFGEVVLKVDGESRSVDLTNCAIEPKSKTSVALVFHPLTNQTSAALTVTLSSTRDGLDVQYAASTNLVVESVRLLDNALWVTDVDRGYDVVPAREGLLIPANSQLEFTHSFDTYAYEGCHMEMLGVVKDARAALITWNDPYVMAEVKSTIAHPAGEKAKQTVASSLVLRHSAHGFQIHFLGNGDYMTIGQAYREVARQKGYLVTWDEKLKSHPNDRKLFGAGNFKLWDTLQRKMDDDSKNEVSSHVNWTFDEAGQVAQHLKNDLKIDRALFIIGGWTHRGYDNQHPDILPAAPECGGNEALARCSRDVQQLGYLFCLHDNYQDIYRDSSSWSENYVMKNPDGSLMRGGVWAGGQAYLTCSPKALELAKRPQNLEAVRMLIGPNAYFIDTTFAAGLQECFDPKHPLTRQDDMAAKQALSDYSRKTFGVFGSECGREWAIPHADFFEGLTGVAGNYYHDANLIFKVGGIPVPLFEVVYRDTIAMYGKYGYGISKSSEYVDHHLVIGRPLNYHNIPHHLYWKDYKADATADVPAGPVADPGLFVRADGGWAEGLDPVDRFIKNTYEVLSPLNELTATMRMTGHQFLSEDFKVQQSVFTSEKPEKCQVAVTVNGGATPVTCVSELGGTIVLPPYGFLIESPEFVAFCAMNWRQNQYKTATLFTLRSLDGKSISHSRKIRVFHGFGDDQLEMPWWTGRVAKETILDPQK